MNILNKVNKYLVEADEKNIRVKIIQFFKKNPKPSDKEVHAFAESLGMDEHKFEEHIYSLLGSLVKTEKEIEEDLDEDFKKPCSKCGGVKFHRPGCPKLQASIRRESERETARRKAKGLPTSPNLGRK
jgi:hypothetical protein